MFTQISPNFLCYTTWNPKIHQTSSYLHVHRPSPLPTFQLVYSIRLLRFTDLKLSLLFSSSLIETYWSFDQVTLIHASKAYSRSQKSILTQVNQIHAIQFGLVFYFSCDFCYNFLKFQVVQKSELLIPFSQLLFSLISFITFRLCSLIELIFYFICDFCYSFDLIILNRLLIFIPIFISFLF